MSLEAWNEGLATAPLAQRAGRWLLWAGIAGMLAGTFLTPPWGKIGIVCAIVGGLLARPPLRNLGPVVWIGAALSGWILMAHAAAWLRGQPDLGHPLGLAYVWLAIPLGAAAAIDPRGRRLALQGLIAAAAASLAVGLVQFAIGLGNGPLKIDPQGTRWMRATGFCAVHLHLGFAGALLAPLCLPTAACGLGPTWLWTGRAIAIVALVISGARNALVGGVAAIAATLMARGGRWLVGGAMVALLVGGLVAVRFAITDPSRLVELASGQNSRYPIWTTTVATIREHPVLGCGGRDAWKVVYDRLYPQVNPDARNEFPGGAPHAHNWYLALAAEYGLPALALHLALIVATLVLISTRRRQVPAAWQAGLGVATAGALCGIFEPLPILAAAGAGFHAALGLCLGCAYGSDERTRISSTGP
jgi:hypothetical protein